MKKVLILNGSKKFGNDNTRLNATLCEVASQQLESFGYAVSHTHIDKGYNPQEEVQKIVQSDILIYQMPAWWMGEPWIVKKYIDEVYLTGAGILFKNDGRSRKDEGEKYGSGGLCQGKKVMFSTTWNAPLGAFSQKEAFFEGKGIEAVLWHLHKAHQFLGMQILPTFMCNDVIKNPQIESYITAYKEHLKTHLG